MASPRNRRHILVTDPPQAEGFTTRRSGGRAKAFQRPANRAEHARQLTVALNRAFEQGVVGRRQVAQAEQGKAGILVAFQAPQGVALNRGSLHCDIWRGSAATLAERSLIGIYPVKGWWQEQPKRDRSEFGARYALIVSIQTDAEDVDIWTPVAQQVGIPGQAVEVEL